MSEYGDKMLDRIAETYEDVRSNDSRPMPRWEKIGPALREAFIAVYFLGRNDALDEQRPDPPKAA